MTLEDNLVFWSAKYDSYAGMLPIFCSDIIYKDVAYFGFPKITNVNF